MKTKTEKLNNVIQGRTARAIALQNILVKREGELGLIHPKEIEAASKYGQGDRVKVEVDFTEQRVKFYVNGIIFKRIGINPYNNAVLINHNVGYTLRIIKCDIYSAAQ